jgi:hypothetical protein
MKDRFLEINAVRKQIQELFHRLEEKKKAMKDNYSDLVSSNDSHFFGLDSFRFQVKLTENELTFLNDQFILIDNRLYCDYYKLYNHVYDYYVEHLPHGVAKSVFPIYKDLQPTKVYEPELVHKLYRDIILLIHKAYETLDHEHRKRESEKRLTTSGIHIGNYVHNRVFADTLVKTNIQLFEEYLNTYFIYHMTFLVNLKDRLGMFLDHVLRKQPEQGCNVDEVDDDFMRVAKTTSEPMAETKSEDVIQIVIHSDGKPVEIKPVALPVAEPPALPVETPMPVAESVVESPALPAESPVLQVETPVLPVEPVALQVETPTPVVDPVAETPSLPVETPALPSSEPVADPVAETPVLQVETPTPVSETISEETQTDPTVDAAVDAAVENVLELTIEEVINPIINHILEGSTITEDAEITRESRVTEAAEVAEATRVEAAKASPVAPTKKKRPRKK